MTSYWADHAWLPRGLTARVRIRVSQGLIAGIETDVDATSGDVRLRGVVLPGLANAHSHAFHRALRGHVQEHASNILTWRDRMYAIARQLNPDTYLALARAVYCEMALAGYTLVGEFHYVHHRPNGKPYGDPNVMSQALRQAASEAGVRLTILDSAYFHGALTGEGHLPLDEVQARFGDPSVGAWLTRADQRIETPKCRLGYAAHSIRTVSRDELAELAELVAAVGDRPLHVHLSQQPAENLAAQMYYGQSPARLLDSAGALGPRTTVVHATHLSDEDIHLIGGTGTGSCICPTTERDLADGIGPARRLHDAGSPISLGSDSHAVVDAFEELRALEMNERVATNERGRFDTGDLILAGSFNGYRSLGWDDGGHLSTGALADFVVVKQDSVNTAGCQPGQMIYAATTQDIETVVVGGTVIAAGGQHRLGPVGPMLKAAIAPFWD